MDPFVDLQRSLGRLISPTIMWWVFGLMVVFAIVMSVILMWHWSTYGTNSRALVKAQVTYLVVTGAILILGFLALASFPGT